MRHTVDAPVCIAVLVADGDGEPAVVGPDHLDGLAGVAEDAHGVAFAAVSRLVLCTVWGLT